MKIYGYKKKGNNKLLDLSEVTFHININELKEIIKFFQYTEIEMEKFGKDFNHEHYNTYIGNDTNDVDIIICNE